MTCEYLIPVLYRLTALSFPGALSLYKTGIRYMTCEYLIPVLYRLRAPGNDNAVSRWVE